MLMWLTNVRFKIDAMLNAVQICTNCIIYHMMHSKWSFVRMGHSNFWGENNMSMPTCGHLHTHPWYDIDTHLTTKENNTRCHVQPPMCTFVMQTFWFHFMVLSTESFGGLTTWESVGIVIDTFQQLSINKTMSWSFLCNSLKGCRKELR
jgi:hypothetical protein